MNIKTAQIIIGRKELCDIYKGKEVEVKARILNSTSSTKIEKGIAAVLDNIIKRRYLGKRRQKNDCN